MKHRLTSVSLSTSTDLSDRILDDIDRKITTSLDISDQNTSGVHLSIEVEKLNQLKQDIIHQGIQTSQAMVETYTKTIYDEQENFFHKQNADQHTSKIENGIVNAIETRRLHMIERGKYITEQKLGTCFKPVDCTKQNQFHRKYEPMHSARNTNSSIINQTEQLFTIDCFTPNLR